MILISLIFFFFFIYFFYLFTELNNRPPTDNTPVHIINIDVQDNHEEATIGAFSIYELAQLMSKCEDLDSEIDELILEYESKIGKTLLHSIAFQ